MLGVHMATRDGGACRTMRDRAEGGKSAQQHATCVQLGPARSVPTLSYTLYPAGCLGDKRTSCSAIFPPQHSLRPSPGSSRITRSAVCCLLVPGDESYETMRTREDEGSELVQAIEAYTRLWPPSLRAHVAARANPNS